MRVVNRRKENARIYILNHIKSILTNVVHEREEINNTVTALNHVIGGSSLGTDSSLTDDCKHTKKQLDFVIQNLNRSIELAGNLDTSEEIPDEQYK